MTTIIKENFMSLTRVRASLTGRKKTFLKNFTGWEMKPPVKHRAQDWAFIFVKKLPKIIMPTFQ
jgi:hypothetical protein